MAAQDKLRNAVGLSMRAGKCASGAFVVEKIIRAGKAQLVLLDAAAAENARKRYADACRTHGVPMILVPDAGGMIGKDGRMVLAITDKNFANMIIGAYAALTADRAASGVDADVE